MPKKSNLQTKKPKQLSRRARQISSFIAMDILEAGMKEQAKGYDVISFSIGEPDFPSPEIVKEATIQAIRQDFTKYTQSLGTLELRDEIASFYKKRYGVSIVREQIVVTPGTSPAMILLFGALLDPGDEIIMTDPHYPCYSNFVQFMNGKVVTVKVREKDGFQYRPEDVKKKITRRTKGIFINSPSNPTGCLLSGEVMQKLSKLGPYIISDEIYHGLTYEGEERSILEYTDRAFVLNGFSKAFAMTGFRLGYLIAPKEFIPALQKMQQNFYISTSSFVQSAGIAALRETDQERAEMKRIFSERRRVMIDGLRELGFKIEQEPTGAFYVFVNAKHLNPDSHALALEILKKAKVGVTPGIDFGKNGEGYLRFSYAVDVQKIREGLNRIGVFLKKYKKSKK